MANTAERMVESWLSLAGLQLAAHKTEAVLISSRQLVETAKLTVGGVDIVSQRAIKYLGVMIDTRLSYKEHLEYANKKAAATARSLARIVLNTRGPRQERRKLIASVVTSQVLYAAPVWAKAATTPSYMSGVARTHRLYATRISCAFRAISEEAALVIAGLVPVQELVGEAEEVEETVTTNLGAISRWQKRWDSATSGR